MITVINDTNTDPVSPPTLVPGPRQRRLPFFTLIFYYSLHTPSPGLALWTRTAAERREHKHQPRLIDDQNPAAVAMSP